MALGAVLAVASAAPATAAGAPPVATSAPAVGWHQQPGSATCAAERKAATSGHGLAVRIVRALNGAVALVDVCVEGAGPFSFLIDTGSSRSVIDTALARRFHLRPVAPPEQAAGIGCATTVTPDQVSSWSLDGVALRGQELLAASVPSLGRLPLAGVIGSDLLSRFGSIRLDYRTRTIDLDRPESSTSTTSPAVGTTIGPTPAEKGSAGAIDTPLRVVAQGGAVAAYASISFGPSGPVPFVVDTGAAISAVSSSLVSSLHLAKTQQSVALAAFGCPVRASEVRTGAWKVGATPMPAQTMATLPASGIKVNGLLGSDVFFRYGTVIVDYRDSRLVVEAG
jgi:predicted aspartyl protease